MPNSTIDTHNRAVRLLGKVGVGRRWEGRALLRLGVAVTCCFHASQLERWS